MSRTCSRVQVAQMRSIPRVELDSDHPGGSASPPASSSLVAPQRLQVVVTRGTVAVRG